MLKNIYNTSVSDAIDLRKSFSQFKNRLTCYEDFLNSLLRHLHFKVTSSKVEYCDVDFVHRCIVKFCILIKCYCFVVGREVYLTV